MKRPHRHAISCYVIAPATGHVMRRDEGPRHLGLKIAAGAVGGGGGGKGAWGAGWGEAGYDRAQSGDVSAIASSYSGL